MKVAIAQLTSSTDKIENLAKAQRYISQAKKQGADLVILPEVFMVHNPFSSSLKHAEVAEPVDGPFVTGLAEAARSNEIYVICGMLESKPDEDYRAYNTTVFLDRSGKLLQRYRKTHLYDAFTFRESDRIVPGDEPYEVVETEFGKIGLMVCYEIRFPEIARQLVLQGADILCVPSGWVTGLMKEYHWQTLVTARAIENTVYICAADQVGNIYSGRSMVVDPMGVMVGSAGEEEALFTVEVDLERINRVRDKLPSVVHRRTEFYKLI